MKNGEIHALAMFGTVAITVGLTAPVVYFAGRAQADTTDPKIDLDHMDVIEASLAYESPKAPVQPQKKTQEKQPDPPAETVHDPDAKPVEKKPKPPDEKKPKPDEKDPFKDFHHPTDDPVSEKPVETLPPFNGSKFGTDIVTTGHPFWQQMKVDLAWEYPTILNATAPAVGCIHLEADGKIPEITIHQKSGDDSLDDAAERALKRLQKKRNDTPIPIPTELLKPAVVSQFVCFKFDAKKSE